MRRSAYLASALSLPSIFSVTSRTFFVSAFLTTRAIEDLFDAYVEGDVLVEQGLPGKPAPDSFLRAAVMRVVVPERAVVIEGAICGVRAARGGRPPPLQ